MKKQIIDTITGVSEVKKMTSNEEKLHNQLLADNKILEDNFEAKAKERETKKTSAKTKLKELGLDDAELKTLGL